MIMNKKLTLKCLTVFALGLLVGQFPASAFYNPSTGRWLSRDPIGENGGANLYSHAANQAANRIDVLGRIGYGWEGILLGPKCKDPCGDAKAQGLAGTDVGGQVCCGGRLFACVWVSGGISQSKEHSATVIIDNCSMLHEASHLAGQGCAGCGLYRPRVMIWNLVKGECDAYYAQMTCLKNSRSQCGGDPVCEAEVDAELLEVNKRVVTWCGFAAK